MLDRSRPLAKTSGPLFASRVLRGARFIRSDPKSYPDSEVDVYDCSKEMRLLQIDVICWIDFRFSEETLLYVSINVWDKGFSRGSPLRTSWTLWRCPC